MEVEKECALDFSSSEDTSRELQTNLSESQTSSSFPSREAPPWALSEHLVPPEETQETPLGSATALMRIPPDASLSEKSSPESQESPFPSGKRSRPYYTGPAPKKHKILKAALAMEGVSEEEMPLLLKDKVSKRGRLGPLGQVKVKAFSGVVDNAAKKWVQRFEKNTGGRDDIIEKLMAVSDQLGKGEAQLLQMMLEGNPKGIPHLMALSKAEPVALFKAYSKGAMVLGQVQAAIAASRAMPALMKDLARHAIDGTGKCDICVGLGRVKSQANHERENVLCPSCKGSGEALLPPSKHKEFAATKILEIGGVVSPKGGPTVNVSQQVLVAAPKGAFMERIIAATDEVVFRGTSTKKDDIVDGEVLNG